MSQIQLLYTKVRNVKSPNRANEGDAGLDFYVPILTGEDIRAVPQNMDQMHAGNLRFKYSDNDEICCVSLTPGGRVLIPSGIRVLIEPKDSMLMAANKSGVATKTGLLYTAEIIDSPYTGEMHIGIFNSSPQKQTISLTEGKKIMQFIHVPIILSNPVEIPNDLYEAKAKDWGSRGSNGFGSSDNK